MGASRPERKGPRIWLLSQDSPAKGVLSSLSLGVGFSLTFLACHTGVRQLYITGPKSLATPPTEKWGEYSFSLIQADRVLWDLKVWS